MNNHCIFVAASITLAGAALAQTVYESKDRSGPVFTDKPSAGASVVQLQPPNAIAMPAARPAPQASAPAFAYLNLIVVALEAQGTVHTNTSAFDLRARWSPALRASDRIVISLDGNLLKMRFRGTNLRIGAADWTAAADSRDNQHTIEQVVVDTGGTVLIASPPVAFYVRHATIARERRAR